MQFYMAPMEGITGYIFRQAYHKCYGNVNCYFAPFIMSRKLNQKEIRDILPENNEGMKLVPQILTNRAEDFLGIAGAIQEFGYTEVNLNLGCPSPTVTARNRGAGFLGLPGELKRFLDEIFEKCPLSISIKTRIGVEDEEEWPNLLAIYEKFPLEELIIHPRLKSDLYKTGTIHTDAFGLAAEKSRHSLCYNGDINRAKDYEEIIGKFPGVEKVMLGRGILRKPWLVGTIRQGNSEEQKEKKRLRAFHDTLLQGYIEYMSGDRNTLYKMKELWAYLGTSFENSEKYLKKIRKSQRISEYLIHVNALFGECRLIL
jgi:tRNA-dihydrouridine synthase